MYIKIVAWHIIKTWTRVPGSAKTLCGRYASGPTAEGFGDEASCETCLRIAVKTK